MIWFLRSNTAFGPLTKVEFKTCCAVLYKKSFQNQKDVQIEESIEWYFQ